MHHTHRPLPHHIHPQALAVQGNGAHHGAAAGEDSVGLGVAGILHAVSSVPAQQLHQKGEQRLRARPHHDLLRIRPDAAKAVQVLGNGSAQLWYALGMGGGQQGVCPGGEHLPHELGPGGEGEQAGVHAAGGEVVGEGGLRLEGLRRGERGRGRPVLLLHRLDEKAPLGLGAEVALRQQLAVGPLHRHHADFQVGGQGPLGGQPLPGPQPSPLDLVPDVAVELLVEGAAAGAVQNGGEHGHLSNLTWQSFEKSISQAMPKRKAAGKIHRKPSHDKKYRPPGRRMKAPAPDILNTDSAVREAAVCRERLRSAGSTRPS